MATAFPSGIGIADFKLQLSQNRARFKSAFTGQMQVVSLNGGTGDHWVGTVKSSVLTAADVRELFGWLNLIGHYENEMLLQDPDYSGPVSGASSGTVNGGGQSGTSMSVNASGVYYPGECFQVGNEFKVITQQSSGASTKTINFQPALRTSPSGGASIDFATPEITAWLSSPPQKETDDLKMGSLTFSFEEVV